MPLSNIVLGDGAEVTPGWLDEVLRRSGALAEGAVAEVEVAPWESVNGTMVTLHVRYAAGSRGTLPKRLLLKLCRSADFGASEVLYYARDYADLPAAPLPTCYDAAYDPVGRRYHILMEDLSPTHRPGWDIPVTEAHGLAVAEALGHLHSHYWGPERITAGGGSMPGAPELERYFAHIRPGLEPMLEHAVGDIAPGEQALVREIFDCHPPLLRERAAHPAGFTLVHGDVNSGNVLQPLEGVTPIYLIDRQPFDWSLTTWLGVSDLVYWMVLWWEPEVRRRYEQVVLRHYHAALLQRGCAGYGWEQLLADYRLCALQAFYVAAEWCVLERDRERMKWVWLRELRRALAAAARWRPPAPGAPPTTTATCMSSTPSRPAWSAASRPPAASARCPAS